MKKFIVSKGYLVTLLLLVIPILLPLFSSGYFPVHDDLQAFRIQQMDKCLTDGQIPCRWIPDGGYQYGAPTFNYYAPGVYYMGELVHKLGFSFIDSSKILFGSGILLAALAMYIFLQAFFNRQAAFIGALAYTYAPYKAVDLYVRGDLGELWSFVFFPLIFWTVWMIFKNAQKKYFLWFSVSLGGLLLTHSLMSLIFIPLVFIWIVVLAWVNKGWPLLWRLLIFTALAVGLASFFLLPFLLERQFINTDNFTSGGFDFRYQFVSLYQIFVSNFWGYGTSVWGSGDGMSLALGYVQWVVGLFGVVAAFRIKKNPKLRKIILVLAVALLGSIFLMHQKSEWFWQLSGVLKFLQFPWRFLGLAVFLVAILVAFFIQSIQKKSIRLLVLFLVVLSLVAINKPFFQPRQILDINDQSKFSGKLWEEQLLVSVHDYLPAQVRFPDDSDLLPAIKPKSQPEVLDGVANFSNYSKKSNYQFGELNSTTSATLRIPMFDFPGMKVMVDSQVVGHWSNDCRYQSYCLGLVTFKISPGQHIIKTQLTNTPPRTLGNVITLLSCLIFVGLTLAPKKYVKALS